MTPKEKPREERMTSEDMARSHCGDKAVSNAQVCSCSNLGALDGGHAKGWWEGSGWVREVWRRIEGGFTSSEKHISFRLRVFATYFFIQ